MKEIVQINITEHDIFVGRQWQARKCPICCAFRKTYKAKIAVGRYECWVDFGDGVEIKYKLLPEAVEWITNYDEKGIRERGKLNLFEL